MAIVVNDFSYTENLEVFISKLREAASGMKAPRVVIEPSYGWYDDTSVTVEIEDDAGAG